MTTPQSMYALSLDQQAKAIIGGGSKRTVLVEGHMGSGKSTLLKIIADQLKTHTPFYFDCNTKTDAGDIALPLLNKVEAGGCVTYVPNEEMGLHLDTPIILMVDEFGKANKSVKNAMLRLMLERTWGSKKLHPDTIIFATTNLGAEGVGDMLLPHERNRITVSRSRKPSNMEWIEWGLNNDINHSLLGWCKEEASMFESFEDVPNPEDNEYIFHPQQQRNAFVTPRSLEAASDWLKVRDRDGLDNTTITSYLIGTIGAKAAMDLMTFVNMSDQLPTLESIKDDPMNAIVPTSAAATCMVTFRTLSNIDKSWIDAWMIYMERLDTEAQGLFVNGVRAPKYGKQSVVMMNKKFTEWCDRNMHLYSADKV
jgi:energy-coupling factor transporter ATP-binding protein EcfA2